MFLFRCRRFSHSRLCFNRSQHAFYSSPTQLSDIIDVLQRRGLLAAHTGERNALRRHLSEKPRTIYVGFDPTASSLHLGNLLPLIALKHLQHGGHRPIVLIGGATGLIGDPSGRESERSLLSADEVRRNVRGIRVCLERLFAFGTGVETSMSTEPRVHPAVFVDNAEWYSSMSVVDFLRDAGKHFRVASMLAKDSVRARLQRSESGMSFTEFAYQSLQAHDFWHLYTTRECTVQLGGSDQWGNITAGSDLIHRRRTETECTGSVFGVTVPLLTTAKGAKFGKSAGNAIWLDPDRTSPYEMYQYLLQTDDDDVIRLLRLITFTPDEEIESLAALHAAAPEKREAHRALARCVTEYVHGTAGLQRALCASELLFGAPFDRSLSSDDILAAFQGVPSAQLQASALTGSGDGHGETQKKSLTVLDLATRCGVCASRSDARRLIKAGGFYLNNERVNDPKRTVSVGDLIGGGKLLVLRTGKKKYRLVHIE